MDRVKNCDATQCSRYSSDRLAEGSEVLLSLLHRARFPVHERRRRGQKAILPLSAAAMQTPIRAQKQLRVGGYKNLSGLIWNFHQVR
jgi:hypothetical protein